MASTNKKEASSRHLQINLPTVQQDLEPPHLAEKQPVSTGMLREVWEREVVGWQKEEDEVLAEQQ